MPELCLAPTKDAIASLFIERLPEKPYCSSDLSHGLKIRAKQQALKHSHIQANPPATLAWLIFDVDRNDAAFRWDDVTLPPPTVTAINPENGHAHLMYAVETPVFCYGEHTHPLRYAAAIQHAYTIRLGADQGYAGLIAKNPLHEQWHVLWHPLAIYELGQLAEYVDLAAYKPHKDTQATGLGRNCALFDSLRQHAYKWIKDFKHTGDAGAWFTFLLGQAEKMNQFTAPLPHSEVKAIAKSVSKWTWSKMDISASNAKFSTLQAHRGKLGNAKSQQVRKASAENKAASARLMSASGMSQRQIAKALKVSPASVNTFLKISIENQ